MHIHAQKKLQMIGIFNLPGGLQVQLSESYAILCHLQLGEVTLQLELRLEQSVGP